MLQRIQTIFLFLTAVVTGLMFLMPVAIITIPNDLSYDFYTTRVVQAGTPPVFIAWNWMSMILNIFIPLLALVTIFVYKKRFLQIRLCIVNIILQLGMLILMWVQLHQRTGELNAEWFVKTTFILPVVGIILTWLAMRGIFKDISLLKSLDRIR